MLGFKQYLLTSFSYLLQERIDNYFLLNLGPNLPLFVEEKSFFLSDGEEISLQEGADKTHNLYGNAPGVPNGKGEFRSLILQGSLDFVESIEFDNPETFKYYELAAEYLKQNGLIVYDNKFIDNLTELFYQRLYLFKKAISLTTAAQNESYIEFLNFLKKDSSGKTFYEFYFDIAEKGNPIAGQVDKFKTDKDKNGAKCCKFSKYKPSSVQLKDDKFRSTLTDFVDEDEENLNKILTQIAQLSPLGFFDDDRDSDIINILNNKNPAYKVDDAVKCYICKRRADVIDKDDDDKKRSVLYYVEDRYGKLNDDDEKGFKIGKALNCKKYGFSSARGAVKGGKSTGAAAADCKKLELEEQSKPESEKSTTDINTLNYGADVLNNSIDAVSSNSGYRALLKTKIQKTNDNIDKNLITIIDGEQ